MRICHGFENLPAFSKPVVTVGSYDGIHAGHRQLLERVVRHARERAGESVVITFSPHPRQVLGDGCDVKLLNTLEEKAILLEDAGIDNLIIAPFTVEFSKLSPYDFVKGYLVDKVGVDALVVGYNHHFGRNKEGDFNALDNLNDRFGFDVYMVEKQQVGQNKVSSTIIRNLVCEGRLGEAAKCLGYNYFLLAELSIASGLAGELTVGDTHKLLPPAGVYPVQVSYKDMSVFRDLRISNEGRLVLSDTGGLDAGEKIIVTFC